VPIMSDQSTVTNDTSDFLRLWAGPRNSGSQTRVSRSFLSSNRTTVDDASSGLEDGLNFIISTVQRLVQPQDQYSRKTSTAACPINHMHGTSKR
jgi:hypothetical protein